MRTIEFAKAAKDHWELFAKYPEVVAAPTQVSLISSDSAGVPIRGRCELIPVIGSNYASGLQ